MCMAILRENHTGIRSLWIKDEKKDIANLMKYARERRVVKKVQSMIGVWL